MPLVRAGGSVRRELSRTASRAGRFHVTGEAQKGCLAFPNSGIPEAFLEVDGEGFRKPRPLSQKPALLSVSEIASKSMWKKK